MSNGKVVQVIGAVVDVEFPRDSIPKIYDALRIDDANLTLEVQQQLGDGVVRTIAMGASEGLKRGLAVTNTGKPIPVPVGKKTLGRIMDVLGNPIDEAGPIGNTESWPIHRAAPELRRPGQDHRAARDRHQGHRPDHADLQGRQDRPVRRRRRRQDRDADGADQQHRQRARRLLRVRRRRRADPRR